MFKTFDFHPLPGLKSPHLQMFFANFGPKGIEPPSQSVHFALNDGDRLSCEVSTPILWQLHQPTIALVHGLGGSHQSGYMIRLSRKLYQSGIRVVRINLRGCGSGKGMNQLPYNSGNSHDVWTVIQKLKAETPLSPITLIGFSLGGNLILKMAGELGSRASMHLKKMIAVCPVLDIAQSVLSIARKPHWLYHKYYLKSIFQQGQNWIRDKTIRSIYDFDDKVTAPLWGYKNAHDYYDKCSSSKFIAHVEVPCDLLLAADDPFIDHNLLKHVKIPAQINAWLTSRGGHMGYIGWAGKGHGVYCLDQILLEKLICKH